MPKSSLYWKYYGIAGTSLTFVGISTSRRCFTKGEFKQIGRTLAPSRRVAITVCMQTNTSYGVSALLGLIIMTQTAVFCYQTVMATPRGWCNACASALPFLGQIFYAIYQARLCERQCNNASARGIFFNFLFEFYNKGRILLSHFSNFSFYQLAPLPSFLANAIPFFRFPSFPFHPSPRPTFQYYLSPPLPNLP